MCHWNFQWQLKSNLRPLLERCGRAVTLRLPARLSRSPSLTQVENAHLGIVSHSLLGKVDRDQVDNDEGPSKPPRTTYAHVVGG